MRIAVIGCGTAGAAAALFLKRDGHDVRLYERFAEPGPVGAGLLLQPLGLHVLRQLGLLRAVSDMGAPIRRLHGLNHNGRTVLDLSYADLEQGLHGVGIHRGALFQTLWQALSDAGIETIADCEVVDLSQNDNGVRIDCGSGGKEHADIAVIADGARSVLRADLGGSAKPYPWGAVWTTLAMTADVAPDVLAQRYRHATQMCGVMPCGFAPGSATPALTFFWSMPLDAYESWRSAPIADWKEEVLRLWPDLSSVLEAVRDQAQFSFASYCDARMRPYHRGRVVCIGDAAHATSPQLGQGANLGLYDAMVLARCLAEKKNPFTALALYSEQRRSHIAYYQFASRWLTPMFQSHSRGASLLRDATLGWVCRAPFLRTQMLMTLAGVKGSLLGCRVPLHD